MDLHNDFIFSKFPLHFGKHDDDDCVKSKKDDNMINFIIIYFYFFSFFNLDVFIITSSL